MQEASRYFLLLHGKQYLPHTTSVENFQSSKYYPHYPNIRQQFITILNFEEKFLTCIQVNVTDLHPYLQLSQIHKMYKPCTGVSY